MRLSCLSAAVCLVLAQAAPGLAQTATNTDLYPPMPQLTRVWSRVADSSPRLRSVEACEFSPDGTLAVSGSKFGYAVMLWRVADGHLLWTRYHDSEVECVTFSPNGQYVASGGEDYFVRLWDVASGEQVHTWELTAGIDGIAWSTDGAYISAGLEDGRAVFISMPEREKAFEVACGSTINSLDWTADSKHVLVGGNIQRPGDGPGGKVYTGFVKLIDVAAQHVSSATEELTGSIKSVRWSPDETQFAAAGFDQLARLFNRDGMTQVREFRDSLNLEAVAFSPDGQFLLTGGHGRYLSWYSLTTSELVFRQPAARIEYIDFSADGRLLLTGCEDSGLLNCDLLESDVQARGNYQQVADEQLSNRDLQPD